MDNYEVLKFFESDESLSKLINKSKVEQVKNTTFKTTILLIFAALLSLFFQFEFIGWLISFSFAILISIICFRPYRFFCNNRTIVGTVEAINHDYKLETKKGTKGFSQSNVYTSIKQTHNILITFTDLENNKHEIICSSKLEKIFRVGDLILYNQYLNYPANLTNITKCVCVNCGTMQNSDNVLCYNCNSDIYNCNTLKNTINK